MKNAHATFAAPTAMLVLLLSAMPAAAEDAPVKVDTRKIEKLTEQNAPKPTLSERLSAPFKSDKSGAAPIDPRKEPTKPKPAAEMLPTDTSPKPFVAEKAPEVKTSPTAVLAPKMNDKSAAAPTDKGKALVDENAGKKDLKSAPAKMPAPESVAAEKPQEEKSGLSKWLPW